MWLLLISSRTAAMEVLLFFLGIRLDSEKTTAPESHPPQQVSNHKKSVYPPPPNSSCVFTASNPGRQPPMQRQREKKEVWRVWRRGGALEDLSGLIESEWDELPSPPLLTHTSFPPFLPRRFSCSAERRFGKALGERERETVIWGREERRLLRLSKKTKNLRGKSFFQS